MDEALENDAKLEDNSGGPQAPDRSPRSRTWVRHARCPPCSYRIPLRVLILKVVEITYCSCGLSFQYPLGSVSKTIYEGDRSEYFRGECDRQQL